MKNNKPSVLVGVASSGLIQAETTFSLVRGVAHLVSKGYPTKFIIKQSCYVHTNRNEIVKNALQSVVDYLMFVDSDIVFEPDAIEKLILHGKEIIGGIYHSRDEYKRIFAYEFRDGKLVEISDKNFSPKQLKEVEAIATGFMLIDTKIFKKLSLPFFFYGDPIKFPELSDDLYFCMNARTKGIKVWADPDIEIKHIGNYRY